MIYKDSPVGDTRQLTSQEVLIRAIEVYLGDNHIQRNKHNEVKSIGVVSERNLTALTEISYAIANNSTLEDLPRYSTDKRILFIASILSVVSSNYNIFLDNSIHIINEPYRYGVALVRSGNTYYFVCDEDSDLINAYKISRPLTPKAISSYLVMPKDNAKLYNGNTYYPIKSLAGKFNNSDIENLTLFARNLETVFTTLFQ